MAAELSNGAFCALPFVEDYRSLNKLKYLCCHSPIVVDDIDDIREKMWNGIKVPHCDGCYKADAKNIVSARVHESDQWVRDPIVKAEFEKWVPGDPFTTYFYDLRYDNKCNLACITCSPMYSTLWMKDLGIPIVSSEKLVFDFKNLHSTKKLYLAGGEPLIIDEYYDILAYVADNKLPIEVVVATNLTNVSDKALDAIKRIPNCCLVVSVDSFGAVNDYHRWPSKWNKFASNLQAAHEAGINLMFNTVVDAISIIGIGGLQTIEKYANNWNLSILTTPSDLELRNLPTQFKQQAYDSVANLKNTRFYRTEQKFKTQLDHILTEIMEEGNPSLLRNYINTVDQRREINHATYLKLDLNT